MSNTRPPDSDTARLADVESRFTFLDDTVLQLNDVIVVLQDRVDTLEAQLKFLVGKMQEVLPEQGQDQDERPPHY